MNTPAATAIALRALALLIRQRQPMAMNLSVLVVAEAETWPDFAASRATMDSALVMLVPALKEEVKSSLLLHLILWVSQSLARMRLSTVGCASSLAVMAIVPQELALMTLQGQPEGYIESHQRACSQA